MDISIGKPSDHRVGFIMRATGRGLASTHNKMGFPASPPRKPNPSPADQDDPQTPEGRSIQEINPYDSPVKGEQPQPATPVDLGLMIQQRATDSPEKPIKFIDI